MTLTGIVEALVDAGATPAMILAAVRAAEQSREKAEKERLAKGAERQRRHRESRHITLCDVTECDITPETENPSPLFSPLSLSPDPLPLPPYNPPAQTKPAETAVGKNRVMLEDVAVDHIADWLAKKRSEGKYLHHDEFFVVDYFKNYCKSKGKKYADYIAGLRNAFEWERCQPRGHLGNGHPNQQGGAIGQSKWQTAADRVLGKIERGEI